jgi:hypothetical protein
MAQIQCSKVVPSLWAQGFSAHSHRTLRKLCAVQRARALLQL